MFMTRLLSSIAIVLISLVTVIYGSWALGGILILISVLGYLELTKACKVHTPGSGNRKNALEMIGVWSVIAYYAVLLSGIEQQFLVMVCVFSFIAHLFVYVFCFPKFESNQVMSAYFSFLYAPVMLSFIYLTRNLEAGQYIVWLIFFASWGCDTCAYAVGMAWGKLFGNHKMTPKLSPKKSIEGAIGGVLGAGLIGALYSVLFVQSQVPEREVTWIFALICAAGGLISMVGDLAASAIKRNHDIKDYGKCIPGHGGVMDRFDSVVITAPIIYFMAVLFL